MLKYIENNKIDLLVPINKIKKTAFLPTGKYYDIQDIVTEQEIKESAVLQDQPFEFESICKVSVDKAKVILKYPDQYTFNYQMTHISIIIEKYMDFIQNQKDSQLQEILKKFLDYLYDTFSIKSDPVRQQCLFTQINYILVPTFKDVDKKQFMQFLQNKLIHTRQQQNSYSPIYF